MLDPISLDASNTGEDLDTATIFVCVFFDPFDFVLDVLGDTC